MTIQNSIYEEIKVDLKQEILVITCIQSKHFCLLDFSQELEN